MSLGLEGDRGAKFVVGDLTCRGHTLGVAPDFWGAPFARDRFADPYGAGNGGGNPRDFFGDRAHVSWFAPRFASLWGLAVLPGGPNAFPVGPLWVNHPFGITDNP